MIQLAAYTTTQVLLIILCATLALLVLIIAYKKLLAYLGKTSIPQEDYCVLYGLETHPASGIVEFYFTTTKKRNVILELLNDDLSPRSIIQEKEASEGGHIIRYDTNNLPNGTYFYQLRTENQKTMKRFSVAN